MLLLTLQIVSVYTEMIHAGAYNPYFDVEFHLYTKTNPSVSQEIQIDEVTSLTNSNFNSARRTVFLIHGWMEEVEGFFIQETKNEYLKKGDYNVIGVDWSAGGGTIIVLVAEINILATGEVVGEFIQFLEGNGVDIDDVVVVGFSFGAHVAGNAGKYLDGRLPVIFGLDPALPILQPSAADTLTPTDARYVEAIHTFINPRPCGHVDFYPNGGVIQPGCGIDPICAHKRAPRYFIESINGNPKFIGTRCELTALDLLLGGCLSTMPGTKVMGGEPYTPGTGIYTLRTNSAPPFARG